MKSIRADETILFPLINDKFMDKVFHPKVNYSGVCWIWCGAKSNFGHGRVAIRRNLVMAHRVMFYFTFGAIPKGLKVLHSCDNPSCVNPKHLFLGTSKDNTQDMIRKRRGLVGNKSPTRKINEKIALEILNLAKQGIKSNVLADKFKLSYRQIRYIITGKSWQYLQNMGVTY